jgi:hypothetical protein
MLLLAHQGRAVAQITAMVFRSRDSVERVRNRPSPACGAATVAVDSAWSRPREPTAKSLASGSWTGVTDGVLAQAVTHMGLCRIRDTASRSH